MAVGVIILLDLIVNDCLTGIHTLLVIAAPEIHIGQHGIDGIPGDTVAVAVECFVIVGGITGHGIVFHCFQVTDEVAQHFIKRGGSKVGVLLLLCNGVTSERNILEGTNQIEVAQTAKRCDFCNGGLHVATGEGRIFLRNLLSTVNNNVALVDDVVESIPTRIEVSGEDVLTQQFIEMGVTAFNVLSSHQMVTATFAPDYAATDEFIALHGGINA